MLGSYRVQKFYGFYPREMKTLCRKHVHTKTRTWTSIVAAFTPTKKQKQSRRPTEEWVSKAQSIHTREHCWIMKRKETDTRYNTGELSERGRQTQEAADCVIPFIGNVQKRAVYTDTRSACRRLGPGVAANGFGLPSLCLLSPHMLGKHSTSELHPSLGYGFFSG